MALLLLSLMPEWFSSDDHHFGGTHFFHCSFRQEIPEP
jgi:hypothetical protein